MIIESLNGTILNIADFNLKRLYHHIPSAEIEHASVAVEGIGEITTHTQIKRRIIPVEFLFDAYNIHDYYLLRDEINALFTRDESFYIIFKNEPYKRYKVRLAAQFEIPPHRSAGSFTVEFLMMNRYAESTATTTTLKEWNADKWGWNNTITWEDDLQYSFTTNNFTVKNTGTAAIDPRESELAIVIKGTFENFVKITNQTTGEIYQYNSALSSTDELRITGIQTFKNNVSDFKSTNKKLLTLAVGDNIITVEGGTVGSVVFYFRFLYK